ncbi:MAG: porin family protein [Acidimicrobiia bacterium]|nr:porin family protein [Acidimicrobiia bacterium]
MNRSSVTRLQQIIAACVLTMIAAPAAAQVPPASGPGDDEPRAPYSRWSLGVVSGAQDVSRTGITAGGAISVRLRTFVHLAIESGRMSDVVTSSRRTELDSYAAYLRDAYRVPATAEIEGPTLYGLAGLTFMPDGKPAGESSGIRPYITVTAGVARVEYKPAFVVDGQPISGAGALVYNVAIGRDLMGTTNRFAYGGGAGIVFGDTWSLDLGARILRIHTTDHPTTVKRLVIGLGRRF